MNNVSILDCIEAITLGDISFNTLKGVTIDGNITSNDFLWSTKDFAIFKILIHDEPNKLKIWLNKSRHNEEFLKSVDRCNTFYTNLFIKTENKINELTVFSLGKIIKCDVTIIENQQTKKRLPLIDFLNKYLLMVSEIISTNIVASNFSIKWCVNHNDKFKLSLERGGIILPFKDIEPNMLIAFKNFLLSNITYIKNNYDGMDLNIFFENSPKFSISEYKYFNTEEFAMLYSSLDASEEYIMLIKSLLKSNNRFFCVKSIPRLIELLTKRLENSENGVYLKNKQSIVDIENIIGEDKENRIAVINKELNKIGFIDETGELIIKHKYDTVTDFEEGVSVVSIDSKFGAINKYDETMIHFIYDELEWCVEYNIFITLKNGLNGIISRTGILILDCKYLWIDAFHCSRARFQEKETGKFGYIDINGNEVINAEWEDVTSFENGVAKVKSGNNWYKIDIDGEII